MSTYHSFPMSNIQRICPIFSVYLSCRCSWVISPRISDRGSEPQVLVIVIVPSLSWWITGRWGEIWAVTLSSVPHTTHTTTHVWQTASTAHWDVHCLCRNWSRGHVWCDDDETSGLLSANITVHNECKMPLIFLSENVPNWFQQSNYHTWWVSNSYFLISWKYKACLLCTLTAWKGVSESIQCLHKLYQFSVKRMILHFNPSHWLFQQQYIGRYQKPVEVTHESCITYKLKASEIPLKFAILHLHTFYCNEGSCSCLIDCYTDLDGMERRCWNDP